VPLCGPSPERYRYQETRKLFLAEHMMGTFQDIGIDAAPGWHNPRQRYETLRALVPRLRQAPDGRK